MPHIKIYNTETIYLKKEILKKYTALTGYDYEQFNKNLTGTIVVYEKIAEVMCDYLENKDNFFKYNDLLKEGPLKISINKIIASNRPEEAMHFLKELRSHITANVLRKLIYPKPEEQHLTFKEQFINACYVYIHYDRIEFLHQHPIATEKERTFAFYHKGGNKNETQPVYNKEPACMLTALNDVNEIDKEKEPLKFNSALIELNRSNLDPDNSTITRKVQAEISYVDGEWFIENKSQLFTTFILVAKKTKIEKGDILVMGNKKFLFE